MPKSKGGAGKGQGRKRDWGDEPAKSRISVPYDLADKDQKKALAEIWATLKQQGLSLTELALALKNNEINVVWQNPTIASNGTPQLYRMYSAGIAASFGIISSSDADAGGYEEVDLLARLIGNPERTILLEVTGSSMIDEGIFPGSVLVVETTNTTDKSWLEPRDRDIVVALIDGADLTVKQFRKNDRGDFLVPQNRSRGEFQALQVSSLSSEDAESSEIKVEILGIVKSVTRFFK